jgi:hypothetical protein
VLRIRLPGERLRPNARRRDLLARAAPDLAVGVDSESDLRKEAGPLHLERRRSITSCSLDRGGLRKDRVGLVHRDRVLVPELPEVHRLVLDRVEREQVGSGSGGLSSRYEASGVGHETLSGTLRRGTASQSDGGQFIRDGSLTVAFGLCLNAELRGRGGGFAEVEPERFATGLVSPADLFPGARGPSREAPPDSLAAIDP